MTIICTMATGIYAGQLGECDLKEKKGEKKKKGLHQESQGEKIVTTNQGKQQQ